MKCDRSVGRIVLDALRLGKVSFGHGPVVRLKHRVVLCCAVRKCNNRGNDTLDFVRFAGLLGAKSVSFECWKSWNREIVDIWLWSVPRCLLLAACCLQLLIREHSDTFGLIVTPAELGLHLLSLPVARSHHTLSSSSTTSSNSRQQ